MLTMNKDAITSVEPVFTGESAAMKRGGHEVRKIGLLWGLSRPL